MSGILIKNVMHLGERVSLLVQGTDVNIARGRFTKADQVIDAKGLEAVPAFWDWHVHFRDPGNLDAEDMLSGARAAAAGGYGVVFCEPNTRPVMDNVEAIRAFKARIEALHIPITVEPKSALTIRQEGAELVDIESLAEEVDVFSTDGEPVVDRDLLVQAFRRVFATDPMRQIHAHCEETPRSHERVVAALGEGPYLSREPEIVKLHLEALEEAGVGWLRIQHVSLPETVALIEDFKERNPTEPDPEHFMYVEMEVSPHHLILCQNDIPNLNGRPDPNWKMNPPLRSREAALGLQANMGLFDHIATDHAPHEMSAKQRDWDDAPFGVIGLETAFGAVASFDEDDHPDWVRELLISRLSPRATFLSEEERFANGMTLVDWNARWTVDPDNFYSKSRNCPFAGMTFTGKPMYTIAGGKLVMAEGEVLF